MQLACDTEKTYASEIFNVASGNGYSVPELYSNLLDISGKSIKAEYKNPELYWEAYDSLYQGKYQLSKDRIKKEVYKQAVGSPEKTFKEFNWKTFIDIKTGLQSVYNFIND